MPFIQPANVPFSFNGGLSQKSDDFQVQTQGLLGLKNAVFDKVGRLNKRYGYDILSRNVLDGTIINSASAIDFFNNELILFDNQNLYSYIDSNGNWAGRGQAISLINTNKQIVRTAAAQQLNPDSAYLNGIEVYVWEDSRGPACRYSTIDTETNSYPIYDQEIPAAINKPKVIAFNGLFYVFYAGNNNLYYRIIDPDNPFVITNAVAVEADCYADYVYDIRVNSSDSRLYIAYVADTGFASGDFIKLIYLNTSNTVTTVASVQTGTAVVDIDNVSISLMLDSSDNAWVFNSTGASILCTIYNSAGGAVLAPTTVDSTVSPTMTAVEQPNNPGVMTLFYQVSATETYNHYVKSASINQSGTVTAIDSLLSVGLSSKAFVNNEKIFVNLIHESANQPTYFTALLDTSFHIVGKISAKVGGVLSSNGLLPQVSILSAGVFTFPNLIKGKFISEDNTNFSLLGVNATKIDFTNVQKFISVNQSNQLLFVGGILQSYDGASVNEHGFHLYPENSSAQTFTTGGALSVGQYQYKIVYSWTDKNGQVHYSDVSESLTVSTSTSSSSVLLTIPTLRLTNKDNVVIKIYRTQVNSVVFQEVTSELVALDNDKTVDTVQFADILSDADMAANAAIYTTGGVLANSAPPSCSLIAVYRDRVIVAGLEDTNLIWFSKNKVNASNFNTIPVEFSEFNTLSVTQVGGPITALGVMDDKLIIFKRSSIYLLQGDGPNDTGGDAPFPPLQIISNSVGCDNPNSVVFTQNGLMFQSSTKGIWMLDRGLGSPAYIGAGVDTDAKTHTISSATVDPNDNLIIFTTYDGPALIYDYFLNLWGTWTNHNSVDGIPFDNKFTFVKPNGEVYKQNRLSFLDGTDPIQMELITPWFSMGQLQGYQSIFNAFILGQFKTPHTLEVATAYDFDYNFSDGYQIPATLIAGSNLWGNSSSSATWGSDDYWGGLFQPYQFRVNAKRQKCSSVRFRIRDIDSTDEGFTISNLSLTIGVIGGNNRIPARNRVGMT